MSLKSRYRLMRMRSRLGSGRARKALLMFGLAVAGAFVMLTGLIVMIVVVSAAAVFMMLLLVWSLFSRHGAGRHSKAGSSGNSASGVTLEGEYTVQGKDVGPPEGKS